MRITWGDASLLEGENFPYFVTSTAWGTTASSGLYYKNFTIVIYVRNVIGQYYKTTIVAKASPS
jgi:hypothetical protein